MEVTGTYKRGNTEVRRAHRRDNMGKLEKLQEILTSQPLLISGVGVCFLAVAFVEKMSF